MNNKNGIIDWIFKHWIILGLILTVIIKIKYSSSDFLLDSKLLDNSIIAIFFIRPKENTVNMEILSLLNALSTSFLASIIFYELNVRIPFKEKQKRLT